MFRFLSNYSVKSILSPKITLYNDVCTVLQNPSKWMEFIEFETKASLAKTVVITLV